MNKILLSLFLAVVTVSLASTSWAGVIMGTLEKIDDKGSFYFVKDDKGKEHKIHFDKSTQKTGEIKAGAHVEVDEANGHAKSIKVMEMKK